MRIEFYTRGPRQTRHVVMERPARPIVTRARPHARVVLDTRRRLGLGEGVRTEEKSA